MSLSKVASLASVLSRDPAEFVARIAAIAEGHVEPLRHPRPGYLITRWPAVVDGLVDTLGERVRSALAEAALADVERDVSGRLAALRGGPISDRHNGDLLLGRCCYAVIRGLQPTVVVETGVAHGVSTAFMLAALAENAAGELHSIDLPPHDTGAEQKIGACVSERLRARWTLHRGMSRTVLPALLARLPTVDMFVHDSQHTYRNMTFEFDTVWARTRVIVADDVELNGAFARLMRRSHAFSAVVGAIGKDTRFGVLVR